MLNYNSYSLPFVPTVYYTLPIQQINNNPVFMPSNFEYTKQIEKNTPENFTVKVQQKESEPAKTKKIKKHLSNAQKIKKFMTGKACGRKIERKRKDEDFKNRKQTPDRNVASNTLKMFLKQIREPNTQTFNALKQIINFYNYQYQVNTFIQHLNQRVPLKRSYISFESLKPLFKQNIFGKILRSIFRYFYLKEIYCIGHHSKRTTKKLRLKQQQKGRQFLQSMQQF